MNKVTLAGRKRTRDLAAHTPTQEKKAELLALKAEAHSFELTAPAPETTVTPRAQTVTQKKPVDVQPVEKTTQHAQKRALSTEGQLGEFIDHLKQYAAYLDKSGTQWRKQYSPREQKRLLSTRIKEIIFAKAEQLMKQGVKEHAVFETCQQLAKKLVAALQDADIDVIPVYLVDFK